ncbi:ubiquinol-cytochrome-c reductase complex assembly factor 6 isoform X6 [Poeciliopsis prolifica]|uniref:ubiquinol-cytochrome-c reductase complex assembly factor 6 isoform X6 n=1 Tax=Poeciliopsis prolifica TaxID=188132 RepID=UPI0024130DA3|nr:ubiquinol-cytochrome-c reductase complex assembly factor 6 isoform X6 [Poeciliopsis prolifica]XP_054898509.1 ubiquinol-cytochrome-c reductase complex assembly factor 6 isoform X6 [Poeciliopsis prolifica]XP_054898518.1 ubiquinol-cytochrome-c reductase complex assembly factor 6 isoform X6 [Poeciliopsis prolifica]XP_054898528.1 ubiquinol-cytochrome-c reductase complex assembly factor 6 isoform X6 [Poeciliopsis prolifica]
MPAGVSWPRYIQMLGASVLAMFAGAQVVHQYYLPDLSIPEIPPKPGELRTELHGYKAREEAAAAFQKLKEGQKVD